MYKGWNRIWFVSLNFLQYVQKGDGKEIEIAFIVLTPSKYVAARRDAPKIKKIQKNFNLNIKMIKI